MKHLLIRLAVTDGEREYYAYSVDRVDDAADPAVIAEATAQHFYPKSTKEIGVDGWSAFGGEVLTQVDVWSELTPNEFEVLNRYL